MKHKAFVPNKKVSIRVIEGEYQGNYNSRIEEINDDKLILALPFIGTVPVPIRAGDRVVIYSATKDAVYGVVGEVIKRQLEPLPLLYVVITGGIERVQRRNYVRIPILLNVMYRIKGKEKIYNTYTKDVSGGGIKIILPEPLKIQDVLQGRLELLPPEFQIDFEGEVVWIDKEEKVNNNKLEEILYAGVEFTLIDEKERERLIRFLFCYQRDLIKKGLKND
ncbi:MAG: flagellar brake protein [bacterium]